MQAAARLLLLYYGVDRGVARIMLEAGLQAKAKSIPGKDLHRGCVPPRKVFFFCETYEICCIALYQWLLVSALTKILKTWGHSSLSPLRLCPWVVIIINR